MRQKYYHKIKSLETTIENNNKIYVPSLPLYHKTLFLKVKFSLPINNQLINFISKI